MNELRKIPRWKRRIAPADVDRLIDRVNVLSKVTGTGGISVSAGMTGVNIHNRIGAAGRDSFIMEVQSAAAGDGLYTCRKEKLLAAEWSDTAGDDKFSEKAATEYTVLNLMENDPEPGYIAHLIAGSLMECWQIADDGGTSRWVGIPVERLNTTRRAWVKTTPGAVATVTCYLDVNTTGTEITVYCDICGGTSLNAAVPRLSAGDEIYVSNVGGTWYSDFLFQASEDCECTPSLDDLADVTITAAGDHDFVMYDSGTSEWIDQTPAQVLAALTGTAGAAFSWNSQNLTGVGTLGCGAITSTGLLGVTVAGNTAVLQNTTDAASNQVAQFKSGNRATSANDDSGYISLFCDNDAGTQMEMVRLKWIIAQDDVDSEEGALDIQLESSGGGDLQSVLYLSHANSVALFDANVKAHQFWIKDATTRNYLQIYATGNKYSADRQLNIDLNDANRGILLTGNASLDQDYRVGASPTFAGLTLTGDLLVDGGDIGITGDTNLLQLAANALIVDGSLTLGTDGGGVKSLRMNSDDAGQYLYLERDVAGDGFKISAITSDLLFYSGDYMQFTSGANQLMYFNLGGLFEIRDRDDGYNTRFELNSSSGDLKLFGLDEVERFTFAGATGNTIVAGTLTVNGDQTGATDHVFDDCNDIELLEKWRAGEKLPFNTGDMLNRDRLLRDTIIQLHKRVEVLEIRGTI